MIQINKLFIVFLAAFVILSELMLSIDARITFFLYFALIVFFLFSFSKAGPLNREGVLSSIFLIIPIIRVIQLFLHVGIFWNNVILYVCFLYMTGVCIYRYKIKPFNTKKGHHIIYSMIIGILFGVFSNNIFSFNKIDNIIFLLPLIVFTEELYFRGVLQNFIESRYGRVLGIIFVSLIYGILAYSQGIYAGLFFFVVYVIGSMFYTETKNVFVTMGYSLMVHLFYYSIYMAKF